MSTYNYQLNRINQAADWLLQQIKGHQVIALFGEMGAGKTTLIKALCRRLGIQDPVNSPSFALINEYLTPEGEAVFHFDLYRIREIEEIFDLGYEDYFSSGLFTFIEWAERMEGYLPDDAIHVYIMENEDSSRTLSVNF